MESLINKNKNYQDNKYKTQESEMKELLNGQSPHTFLITCADSRISVNELTDTKPGEVFVIRNAGNIVPAYDPENVTNEAITLEYGVCALNIKDIVVFGHEKCGAIDGMRNVEDVKSLPLVYKGLKKLSENFDLDKVANETLDETIVSNVQQQMLNLYSYPFIKERFDLGELNVWGAKYHFSTGELKDKQTLKDLLNK
jgi:carbonic anhydrase